MWNRLRSIRFLQVSQIFQRRKSHANKQDFENKLNLTCQAQSTPQTIGILTKVFCTSGPNLVVLARTGDELSHGLPQNGVNFDFEVKFDLEGQGQSLPKTIGILTKVFYIYGPNLVILAERGDELSRGQARDWRTDGHTHTQTDAGKDNTRRPKLASGKNWRSFVSSVLCANIPQCSAIMIWSRVKILQYTPHCSPKRVTYGVSVLSLMFCLTILYAGIICCMCPANGRWYYIVTSSHWLGA